MPPPERNLIKNAAKPDRKEKLDLTRQILLRAFSAKRIRIQRFLILPAADFVQINVCVVQTNYSIMFEK